MTRRLAVSGAHLRTLTWRCGTGSVSVRCVRLNCDIACARFCGRTARLSLAGRWSAAPAEVFILQHDVHCTRANMQRRDLQILSGGVAADVETHENRRMSGSVGFCLRSSGWPVRQTITLRADRRGVKWTSGSSSSNSTGQIAGPTCPLRTDAHVSAARIRGALSKVSPIHSIRRYRRDFGIGREISRKPTCCCLVATSGRSVGSPARASWLPRSAPSNRRTHDCRRTAASPKGAWHRRRRVRPPRPATAIAL